MKNERKQGMCWHCVEELGQIQIDRQRKTKTKEEGMKTVSDTLRNWGATLCYQPPRAVGGQNECVPHKEAHIQNNPAHLPALADG